MRAYAPHPRKSALRYATDQNLNTGGRHSHAAERSDAHADQISAVEGGAAKCIKLEFYKVIRFDRAIASAAAWHPTLRRDHRRCDLAAGGGGAPRRSSLSRSAGAGDFLLGVAVRTAWMPKPRFMPGVAFSAKFLLECAVVMLGASVSVATVLALGPFLLVGIASVVAMALGASFVICRLTGLPLRMSILIACGNSICGNSAIAAVGPVIGADSDDIAASISFTAVLGVIVVLTLPLLVPVLQLSLTQYGVLAGLTVYAVPQVLAATLPIGALSNQVGTIVKLVRVLMLGPVVLGLSLLARDLRTDPTSVRTKNSPPNCQEVVPWFITGLISYALIRVAGIP